MPCVCLCWFSHCLSISNSMTFKVIMWFNDYLLLLSFLNLLIACRIIWFMFEQATRKNDIVLVFYYGVAEPRNVTFCCLRNTTGEVISDNAYVVFCVVWLTLRAYINCYAGSSKYLRLWQFNSRFDRVEDNFLVRHLRCRPAFRKVIIAKGQSLSKDDQPAVSTQFAHCAIVCATQTQTFSIGIAGKHASFQLILCGRCALASRQLSPAVEKTIGQSERYGMSAYT